MHKFFIHALMLCALNTPAAANPNVDMAYRYYNSCMKTARNIYERNNCAETLNAMVNIYSHDDDQLPPPPDYNPMTVCTGYSGGFLFCY